MPGEEQIEKLSVLKKRMARRGFLKAALLATGGVGAGYFLTACGGGAATPTATETATAAATETATAAATASATETAAATATTSATAAAAAGEPTKGGMVIVAQSQEAVNYNPLLYVNTGSETAVEYAVFDSMWKIDEKGELIPNLATEIPSAENGGISADGLEWTIKLREDVKWHDGEPFTAKDVKFTYDTIMNPDIAVRSTMGHNKVDSFDAPDDYTCKIKLKEPFAPYLIIWNKTSVIPEHILSKVPDMNTAEFNTASPIGTGPFKFAERVSGDHVSFKANPDYHGPGPNLDTLILRFVTDQNIMFQQLQTQEAQVLSTQAIPPSRYEEAKKLEGVQLAVTPVMFTEFIYFNCGNPLFQDKAVRQAIYLGINKESWINDVWYGVPKRTLSYLAPTHWAYNTNLKDPGYDPKKAADMLDAAGWKVGGDGIREKDGLKMSFANSTTVGNKPREQAQQLVQQNLAEIGVKMEIKNMPGSVVWGEYTTKSQFDTLMVAWDPMLYPDPDYTERIHSKMIPAKGGTGANYVQYENPEVDKLCEDGVKQTDQAKRKEIYYRIQEHLLEDLPFAPIFTWVYIFGATDKLQNWKPNSYATDMLTWNYNEWWLKQ